MLVVVAQVKTRAVIGFLRTGTTLITYHIGPLALFYYLQRVFLDIPGRLCIS